MPLIIKKLLRFYMNGTRTSRCLISAHMQKLEKLPRIKSSNDIYGLRKIYDQIEVCARNLKALNIATYGAILAPFLNGVNSLERKNILLSLDSGSQRSYISQKLRNELNLPRLRRECLFIKTFGNSNSKCKNVDIVPLNVITSNKTITIEAICTPDICDPLTNQYVKAVSTNYNHLKNLNLADSSNTCFKFNFRMYFVWNFCRNYST